MLTPARYPSKVHMAMHASAWDNLNKAIQYECMGKVAFALSILDMACRKELMALGFRPLTG